MPAPTPCYTIEGLGAEFRQGELLSNVTQYLYDSSSRSVTPRVIPFAVVASQECDLLREHESADVSARSMNDVLLYEAREAAVARKLPNMNSGLWRQITANRDERYHFLSATPADLDLVAVGLPELVVDFRRYFGIQLDELKRQVSQPDAVRRRCCLSTPYREHLQTRVAFYFQRVSLPEPHES
jgi:hypothetical protein